jgi:ribosomal protein L36
MQQYGPLALIGVDTSPAFFEGDAENDNVQQGNHTRLLRSLGALADGRPTVIATCHPTKNAQQDNLLPRGGGAALAECDGNLVLPRGDGAVVKMHWHGKFRGGDFAPLAFKITPEACETLRDTKGHSIWTVVAHPITEAEAEQRERDAERRDNELLPVIRDHPGAGERDLAQMVGWINAKGEPKKTSVNSALKRLESDKLVRREGRAWVLTKAGNAVAGSRQ